MNIELKDLIYLTLLIISAASTFWQVRMSINDLKNLKADKDELIKYKVEITTLINTKINTCDLVALKDETTRNKQEYLMGHSTKAEVVDVNKLIIGMTTTEEQLRGLIRTTGEFRAEMRDSFNRLEIRLDNHIWGEKNE